MPCYGNFSLDDVIIKQKRIFVDYQQLTSVKKAKKWWLWKWLKKEAPELFEANGAEHVISVDMLQKFCCVCGDISAVKGSDAFFDLCKNKLHYPIRKDIDQIVLQSFIQEIEQLAETLKHIESQSDVDFCIAVSW